MSPSLAEAFTNTFIQLITSLPIGIGAVFIAYAIGLKPQSKKFWILVLGIELIAGGIKLGIDNS